MKECKDLGIKKRVFPLHNYHAIWYNLKTIRLGEGIAKELPPDRAEFYDVSLGTKCNAECPFCYVSATKGGEFYEDICETWNKWMKTFPEDIKTKTSIITEKPFQIAIGSTGEPTIHPQFIEFLRTVYESGVIPNYTTNGIALCWRNKLTPEHKRSLEILEATEKYCGGVAVSFGNTALEKYAIEAVERLQEIDININLHHIISDIKSVDRFFKFWNLYGDKIKYHVLLPLMPSGRSDKGIDSNAWEYLESGILGYNIKNVSFGAHFVEYLKKSEIKTWLYPPESLSKNILLKKDKVVITPSSFNLDPIKIIEL